MTKQKYESWADKVNTMTGIDREGLRTMNEANQIMGARAESRQKVLEAAVDSGALVVRNSDTQPVRMIPVAQVSPDHLLPPHSK